MDDILKRLAALEASMADVRAQVSALMALVPHLSTKADVSALESSIIKWIIGTVLASAALAFSIAKFVK